MYETADSNYLKMMKDYIGVSFTDYKVLDSAILEFQGYPATRLRVQGKSQGEMIETSVLAIVRSNKI